MTSPRVLQRAFETLNSLMLPMSPFCAWMKASVWEAPGTSACTRKLDVGDDGQRFGLLRSRNDGASPRSRADAFGLGPEGESVIWNQFWIRGPCDEGSIQLLQSAHR